MIYFLFLLLPVKRGKCSSPNPLMTRVSCLTAFLPLRQCERSRSWGKSERSDVPSLAWNGRWNHSVFLSRFTCQHLGINNSSECCVSAPVLPILSLVELTALLHYLNPVTGEQALLSSSKTEKCDFYHGGQCFNSEVPVPQAIVKSHWQKSKKSVEHRLKHTHSRRGF